MLSENEDFVRLPNEDIIYTSPPRTSLSLKPPSSYSGKQSFSINSGGGYVYLTNQRIVYLPSQPSQQFQSFAAPLLNLHDSYVSAPFFGPNVWSAIVQPVPNGGIPPSLPAVELKMTFKDGGAFDFHAHFERIKERLQQAVELARESGRMAGDGSQTSTRRGGAGGVVDFSSVHLDELPAYDGPQMGGNSEAPAYSEIPPSNQASAHSDDAQRSPSSSPNNLSGSRFDPPTEPPPGYEETQQQSVVEALENRLRLSG